MDHSAAEHAASGHHGPDSWLQHIPGLPHDPHYLHVNGAVVILLFLAVIGIITFRKLNGKQEDYLVPPKKFGFIGLVDMFIGGLYGIIEGVMGPKKAQTHFPFIGACFFFIFFSNLLGLTPLGSSPSSSMDTSIALGIVSFIYYNFMGFKEHGFVGYCKHFLMGLGVIGVPIAFLELISHAIRPASLGLRLAVNMFVDHTLLLSVQSIFAWLTTVPLLFLGVLVCTVQAFVFTILTAVYVQMATEH